MQGDELIDGELRSLSGLDKIRSVVMRWNLDLATTLKCRATLGLREPHDLALRIGGRETKRIEPHDDGCIRGNGATFTLALPSASRTARAMSGAPGVSPCTQSVSTASFRNVPSTAVTPPFFTNERACRTPSAGSVSTEPAIARDCSVPSG